MHIGRRLLHAALALAALASGGPALSAAQPAAARADFAGQPASANARYVAQWVMRHHDHQGRPFAIVDKKDARIFVFAPTGRMLGASPALLGLAPGDHTVPGIGERPLDQILPHERTTPAGRFESEPGRNLEGEHVVWVEYDSGFAIHRLRPGDQQERRAQRLKSGSPQDNRVSLGCVVVPVRFYEKVVLPTLGKNRAVVYVLPETQPVHALFGAPRPDPRDL